MSRGLVARLAIDPHDHYNLPFWEGLRLSTPVRFNLIDKVEHLADDRIVAVKYVSLAEEYLGDHFPTFPVLPGVLMLEAATQAAGWLLHKRTDFSKSFAVLKEARNVKYGNFVAPGNFLRMEVEYTKPTETGAIFKATGTTGNAQAFSARIEISYFNLADKSADLASLDERITKHNKDRWQVLTVTGVGIGQ
jgi:3-hydroxyacyl-[acyl-carrier-protein] dehydratase